MMSSIRLNKSFYLLIATASFFFFFRIIAVGIDKGQFLSVPDTNPDVDEYLIEHHDKQPSRPFEPGLPKMVNVLTYQRCGSSFFGQLFNTNPDVFYLYEPLDSLYSAMYGTREGWNVPSDITSYWDGTERLVPEREKRAVGRFLQHLLRCELDQLPTETLVHRYWFLFSGDHARLADYIQCLRTNKVTYEKCSPYIHKFCGIRFGEFPQDRMDECNLRLWNETYQAINDKPLIAKNFTKYKTCMKDLRGEVIEKHRCGETFEDVCQRSRLRSTKTVRATMESMDYLLATMPNFRVIHLIRDPRAVVLSRREFDNSGRGKFSMGDMVKEALLYCRIVVRDVKSRRILEKKYPGRIMRIIYEELVKQPVDYAKQIYKFLNTTLPEKTMKWLIEHTTKVQDSSSIAKKWMDKLSYRKTKDIMEQCSNFFKEIPYDWPM